MDCAAYAYLGAVSFPRPISFTEDLKRITVPLLVMEGVEDQIG